MMRLSLIFLTACLLSGGPVAEAGSGQVLTLPVLRPGVKPRSGIRLEIDTRWITGSGYRPVRVRALPLAGGLAPADRSFEVLIRPRGWHPGRKAGAAVGTVELAQGASFGEAVIDIPQTNGWTSFEIETYEDGRYLSDLSTNQITPVGMRFFYDSNEGTPAILVLSRFAPDWSSLGRVPGYAGQPGGAVGFRPVVVPVAGGLTPVPLLSLAVLSASETSAGQPLAFLPDIRVLAGRFPMSYYGGNLTADRFMAKAPTTDIETLRLVSELPFLEIVPGRVLPDGWLGLSGVDVIVASFEELRQLAGEFPSKWTAVQEWLATGTLLCVYDVGHDFGSLPELSRLLQLTGEPDSGAGPLNGWEKAIRPMKFKEEIEALQELGGSADYYWQQQMQAQAQAQMVAAAAKSRRDGDTEDSESWSLVSRGLGAGRVVAINAKNPFPGTQRSWSWLFNTVPPRNWLWTQRHGLSNQQDNDFFWNLLIPGIGRAPIVSFLVLISLFALVIGPVNYFLLLRRQRLYILLVTVPAGALLVTAGLLLYATLADGLGIRARVRSYTEIDQRAGRSVSWSRQTYYAGLAPSGGFAFPVEAAVYPIDHRPGNDLGFEDTSREMHWGDQQYLREGYFLSRTLSQLLVVEPRENPAGLRVTQGGPGDPPTVVNDLGVAAQWLWLRDSEGQWFAAQTVPAGAAASLQLASSAETVERRRAVWNAHRLSYPEGFDPSSVENVTGIFGRPFRGGGATPELATSVLESSLRTALNPAGTIDLPPRSYVAVVERPPTVSLGVGSAREVDGFHVIRGRW